MGSPLMVKFYCPACQNLKHPRDSILHDIQPTTAYNVWTGRCPKHARRQIVVWSPPEGTESIWVPR